MPNAVAVLFGWVGSSDKNLSKYSAMLHTIGVAETWRTTAPTWDVFLAPAALRALAERALVELAGRHPNTPAFIYYFSNGGGFVHEQLLPLLREDAALPAARRRFGASPAPCGTRRPRG